MNANSSSTRAAMPHTDATSGGLHMGEPHPPLTVRRLNSIVSEQAQTIDSLNRQMRELQIQHAAGYWGLCVERCGVSAIGSYFRSVFCLTVHDCDATEIMRLHEEHRMEIYRLKQSNNENMIALRKDMELGGSGTTEKQHVDGLNFRAAVSVSSPQAGAHHSQSK